MSLKGSSASLLQLVIKGRNEHGVGFTLVELLVVIAIVGTLSGIAIPVYTNQITKARNMRAISEIRMLEKEITLFELSNQNLPITLNDIGRGNLLDPWGNPYQFLNFTTISGQGQMRKDQGMVPVNSDYDLYSMGQDGNSVPPFTAAQSYDDIVRADDGGYIGLAREF